ncbi:MAG: dipeptidase [Oscillospiraceae bacterium]|jgi:membrane dipeptidase|nr:dipeptidase [Oscillospiraceae bacterium]
MRPGRFGLYDYRLTPSQEERAERLHDESIIIDMLFQGPLSPYSLDDAFTRETLEKYAPLKAADPSAYFAKVERAVLEAALRDELPEYKQCWYDSGITAGCRQLDVGGDPFELVRGMADCQRQFDVYADWLIKATRAEDIRRAKRENRKAGFLLAQNTLALGKDLDNLDMMYDFGLRVLQLSYNTQTHVAAGCYEHNKSAGVTNFGERFIARMNALGMLVDTGHCSDQTVLDACRISSAPVIASHCCARGVYPHNRAKGDEALRSIADSGGVVGLVTMPNFIHADSHSATMDHFLDQVDYAVSLCGEDAVGIGTDWPMSEVMESLVYMRDTLSLTMGFLPGDGPAEETVEGFTEYRQFINITRGLVARGYSDTAVGKILGGNWLRVFGEVCG